MRAVPELISQKLRRLREAANMSRGTLSHATVRLGYAGVREVTIEAIEKTPGRVPDADIIEALARALDTDADDFYEYPIAVARRDARTRRRPAQRRIRPRMPEIRRLAAETAEAEKRRRQEG